MFKEMLDIFRKHSTLEEIGRDFVRMLDISEEMFEKATEAMVTGVTEDYLEAWLKGRDEELNTLEQSIRRRLFTHLLVSGPEDLTASLAFMNIVRNAERIGDYCKNINQVLLRSKAFAPEPCHALKNRMRDHILRQFRHVKETISTHDEALAKQVVAYSREDQDLCQQYINQLVRGEEGELVCVNPVAGALLFRYFKRVLAHLVHVGASVYQPMENLDIFDEV